MQLNKYLALGGVCSRRHALIYIEQGEVTVNDIVVTKPFFRVKEGDVVKFKKRVVKPEKHVYFILNKPKGYVTTLFDPYHQKTIYELMQMATKERIYPIGRLDQDTTGVLLVTNDGQLAQKLSHPSYEIKKIYHVALDRPLVEEDLYKLRRGAMLRDGRIVPDRVFYVAGKSKKYVGIELHSGKKRIVRRLFHHYGYNVQILDRVSYAGLTKRKLPIGTWRKLTTAEIRTLKQLC